MCWGRSDLRIIELKKEKTKVQAKNIRVQSSVIWDQINEVKKIPTHAGNEDQEDNDDTNAW